MLRRFVIAFAAGLLLAACGGPSTGSSSPVPTDSPTPQPTPSASSGDQTAHPSASGAPADGLFPGIRADVRATDCQQTQGDLPPGLVEVVVCAVASELVGSVTFAQYSTLDDLLDFYEARLLEYGIHLATDIGPPGELPEDCWRGHPSESFYTPAGLGPDTNREGCFVDEDGDAVQLYVWSGPLVLITVEGSTADIAELKAWSWYDAEGGEPALGGPGLWQPPPDVGET